MKVTLAKGIHLYEHQRSDLRFFWERTRACNFSEMGAGKTLPTAVCAAGLLQDGLVNKVVILVPPILMHDWRRVFEGQLDMGIKPYVYHGFDREKRRLLDEDVIITSYQIFVNEYLRVKVKINKKGNRVKKSIREVDLTSIWLMLARMGTCLVVDEASFLRRWDSLRTFAVQDFSWRCRRFYALSGNPAPNGPIGYFPLLYMMDRGLYPTERYFMYMHCIVEGAFKAIVAYRDLDALSANVAQFSVRHLKAECLDLPQRLQQVREIEMSPNQDVLYQQALEEQFLELPDGRVIDIANAYQIITRSRQLASNPMTLGFNIRCPKFEALETDLDSIAKEGKKVVVFIEFVKTGEMVLELVKKLGWDAAAMFGDHDKEAEKVRFQTDPKCNLIVVNPASGGLGTNLSMANYELFFEYSYNLDHHDQALERAHRPGLVGPLTVIYYVMKETVEVGIMQSLQKKKTLSADVLRDPVSLRNFVNYRPKVKSQLVDIEAFGDEEEEVA